MRSIWTGAIGFGLVNIPVKLYSAVQGSELDLDMLDKTDQSHIHFKRVNEDTGKEVEWEDIVKAYKYEGKYVVLDDADFESASPEKTKLIEIFQFVEESEIDSIYYENPYFIEPDENGVKPYALLYEALSKSKKVGVGSFVMRNKEHLVVMKPYKNIILLSTIRFEEEIRSTKDIDVPEKKSIKQTELENGNDAHRSVDRTFQYIGIQRFLHRIADESDKGKSRWYKAEKAENESGKYR